MIRKLFGWLHPARLLESEKNVARFYGSTIREMRQLGSHQTVSDLEEGWAITLRGYKGMAHEEMVRLRAQAEVLPWQRQAA